VNTTFNYNADVSNIGMWTWRVCERISSFAGSHVTSLFSEIICCGSKANTRISSYLASHVSSTYSTQIRCGAAINKRISSFNAIYVSRRFLGQVFSTSNDSRRTCFEPINYTDMTLGDRKYTNIFDWCESY